MEAKKKKKKIALTDLLSFDGQIFPDYIHAFWACQ
jgi:hypothetical protein